MHCLFVTGENNKITQEEQVEYLKLAARFRINVNFKRYLVVVLNKKSREHKETRARMAKGY